MIIDGKRLGLKKVGNIPTGNIKHLIEVPKHKLDDPQYWNKGKFYWFCWGCKKHSGEYFKYKNKALVSAIRHRRNCCGPLHIKIIWYFGHKVYRCTCDNCTEQRAAYNTTPSPAEEPNRL